jgi:hypothetical protein
MGIKGTAERPNDVTKGVSDNPAHLLCDGTHGCPMWTQFTSILYRPRESQGRDRTRMRMGYQRMGWDEDGITEAGTE